MRTPNTLETVMNRIAFEALTGCWLWPGSRTSGYGNVSIAGKMHLVHKFIYEQLKGPVPAGLELDHLCRTRACCNPDHLETVTRQVNVQRGIRGIRTKCPHLRSVRRQRRDGKGKYCPHCQSARGAVKRHGITWEIATQLPYSPRGPALELIWA